MRTFTTTMTLSAAGVIMLTLLPGTARAEAGTSGDDDIVVTAARTEQLISDSGKSITLVDSATIERRQTPLVADLLRTTPGVTISRNGGPGSFTSIFVRGAQSEQTVALIDGVKLNDPSSPAGGFNFADLLTDTIERIEILRGPQSVLWGSQAIGGVINMITRQPTPELRVRASGEYGSHDEGRLTASISGTSGPLAFGAGAGYLTTDGISVFDHRLGGIERDGYRLFGANAKAVLNLAEAVSIDLRGFYTRSKAELDGFGPDFSFGDTLEYQRQEQIVGYGGLNAGLLDGALANRLAVNYALVDRDSYDRALTPRRTLRGRGRNLRFEYQGVAQPADGVRATFGAEHQKENYRTFDSFTGRRTARANTGSVYLDVHFQPTERLNIGGGIRHDDHSGFGGATTLSADASYSPNAGATRVKASYGEGFKAPSLYQLYGEFGDPALMPERARGLDIGIVQKLLGGRLELGATWFTRRVREQIDYDLNRFTYNNLRAVRARGFEIEALLQPIDELSVTLNYTYSKSTNRQRNDADFGKDLARRPRNSLNLSVDHDWGQGASSGVTVSHVSASYDDAGNNSRLEGYTIIDLRGTLMLSDNVTLFGRIENLFDEHYQTAFRYGQEGRTFHGGLRFTY